MLIFSDSKVEHVQVWIDDKQLSPVLRVKPGCESSIFKKKDGANIVYYYFYHCYIGKYLNCTFASEIFIKKEKKEEKKVLASKGILILLYN